MNWLQEELENFLKSVGTRIQDAILDLINEILTVVLRPIVGTPGPRPRTGWIAFSTPDNPPWPSLYDQVYLRFVVPLSIGLLFLALAYVGLRAGSLSEYQRRRLLRRILVALGAAFFWFPIASAGTQFFDALGMTIATGGGGTGALVDDLRDALIVASGGLILALIIYAIESALILLAVLVFAARWLAIIVLTLVMPLLATLWAFEVWPLSQFAGVAQRVAALYPGLLAAGLPGAFLLRIALEADFDFGLGGILAILVAALLIPVAALAAVLTVTWSSSTIRRTARTAAFTGMAATRTVPRTPRTTSTRLRTGAATRGARNVQRGFTGKWGPVRADGTLSVTPGGSPAYALGARAGQTTRGIRQGTTRGVAAGTRTVGRYRSAFGDDNFHVAHTLTSIGDPDQRVTDVLRRDTTDASRRAASRTRSSVSRLRDRISRR